MESYSLPSDRSFPAGKFKNIEFLRFLMSWAIVGFHIVYAKNFASYGLSFLVDYTGKGHFAVWYFFVVSFFFLVLKTRPDCSVWQFVRNRWLRMAPLIIVVTLIGYVLHLCGFWGWNMSVNLEQFLLIHDRCPAERLIKFVFVAPAWYCSVLFLSSILYLSWIKTLSAKHVALVVTSTAFIGLVLWRISPQLPLSKQLMGLIDYGRVFMCLGISYLLATVFVITLQRCSLNTCNQSFTRVLLWTVVEIIFLSLFVASLYGAHWYKLSNVLSVISFACLFYLFIRKEGYLSRLLERDWCVWLGRYAFGIYIVHMMVLRILKSILLPGHREWALAHPLGLLGGMVCAIMLLAILGYHCIEVPIMRYIKSK